MTEIMIPATSSQRDHCSESHSTVTIPSSTLLIGLLLSACMVSVGVSFYAIARSDAAMRQAQLSERETRIMEDDFKYVRAWLSAHGQFIPGNHEDAEGK